VKATAILMIPLAGFIIGGCAYKASVVQYRTEKIHLKHPGWDENTTRKVAARKIEQGMTPEMVEAALGRPDVISQEGDEQKWGYSIVRDKGTGMGEVYREFVYFVYLRDGFVTRTEGDPRQLTLFPWYK
jgi:hypothetical protein